MALSANKQRAHMSRGRTARKVASATVYAGSLVGINTSGLVVPWANTAGLQWLGIAANKIVGTASATDIVEVDESGIILDNIAVTGATAASDRGRLFYASDDDVLTFTAQTNTNPVGRVVDWISSTTCDVQLFTPVEYLSNTMVPVTLPKDGADAASTTATSARAIAAFVKGGFVESIKIHPSGALISSSANFATFSFVKYTAAGASVAGVATITTSATTWVAFTTVSVGTLANNTFSAGEFLTVEITKTADGVIVPICLFQANAMFFR